MLVPGTVAPLPVCRAKLVSNQFIKTLISYIKLERLTLAHITDSFARFVGLLRLPAAHVVAVAQDVADGGGSFLEAACTTERTG